MWTSTSVKCFFFEKSLDLDYRNGFSLTFLGECNVHLLVSDKKL
jgi:hypothetical protein